MSKTITIKIPPWLPEEEATRIIEETIAKLSGKINVNDLRKELNIKPEELTENLEAYNADHLELKEKERLK